MYLESIHEKIVINDDCSRSFITFVRIYIKCNIKFMKTLLYSYIMRNDEGFAPNPYYGVLTLATCKPQLRKNSNVVPGVWIAGWLGKNTERDGKKYGSSEHKLIYLARITEKMSIASYWEHYPQKRPKRNSGSIISNGKCNKCGSRYINANRIRENDVYYGDNIYQPKFKNAIKPEDFILVSNSNYHNDGSSQENDIKGQNVLICEEFYYFSCEKPLIIPFNILDKIRIPISQSGTGWKTIEPIDFISYVRDTVNIPSKCPILYNKLI